MLRSGIMNLGLGYTKTETEGKMNEMAALRKANISHQILVGVGN